MDPQAIGPNGALRSLADVELPVRRWEKEHKNELQLLAACGFLKFGDTVPGFQLLVPFIAGALDAESRFVVREVDLRPMDQVTKNPRVFDTLLQPKRMGGPRSGDTKRAGIWIHCGDFERPLFFTIPNPARSEILNVNPRQVNRAVLLSSDVPAGSDYSLSILRRYLKPQQ